MVETFFTTLLVIATAGAAAVAFVVVNRLFKGQA